MLSGLHPRAILLALGVLVWAAAPDAPALANDQPPAKKHALPSFHDVTREAGLNYKITCGDPVTESLIDVNGQGACFSGLRRRWAPRRLSGQRLLAFPRPRGQAARMTTY